MKRINIIAATLLLFLAGNAQTTQKLTATKANEYGLIYNLPSTVLDITIEAQKTVKKPGEYFKYAKKYLDADNPITVPSQSWEIKSVIVTSRGVADENQRYLMQFRKGTSPYLVINDENLPVALNSEDVPASVTVTRPSAKAPQPTPLETEASQQVISYEMLQSQSSSKRAELAAQQIYALRQSRTELITGQAEQMPPDGQAMQLVLDNISVQEAALTAMFLGTKQESTEVKTFTFTPDSISSNTIIARLSSINGIVDADDLSGDPIYLALDITQRGTLPVNEKTGLSKQFPKGGVAYRIPGKANVTIEYDGKDIFSEVFDIAQYGVVFGLDPSMFTDRKNPAYLIFDPQTGAIKELGTKPAVTQQP